MGVLYKNQNTTSQIGLFLEAGGCLDFTRFSGINLFCAHMNVNEEFFLLVINGIYKSKTKGRFWPGAGI